MQFKRCIFLWKLAGIFVVNTCAHAQIPVTDSASIAQSALQQVETIAKWKLQLEQMQAQIDQARQQYTALTGQRGLGHVFNDPSLRDYLPDDWQSVYDSIRSGGYGGLTGTALQLYENTKLYDGCSHHISDDERVACEAQATKPAQDMAFALAAYEAAKRRVEQIDLLMGHIDQTTDPKAIAELQGRIATEQANIQNEQTKLQLYALVAAAEDKVQAQRKHELAMKDAAKRGGLNVEAMSFR